MANNKLMDVTNYFLENANNGILNIIENEEFIERDGENIKLLTEENLEKINYLYDIVTEDISSFLVSSFKILCDEHNDDNNFYIDYQSRKQSKNEFYCKYADVQLKQSGKGNRPINFEVYACVYYKGDEFLEKKLEYPAIVLTLFLFDSDKYDAESIRNGFHKIKYANLEDYFNEDICAYSVIEYNADITPDDIAYKIYSFLYEYLEKRKDVIFNAKIKNRS